MQRRPPSTPPFPFPTPFPAQAYLRAIPKDPCTNQDYVYTGYGTPPTDYKMSITFPATNPCNPLTTGGGLNYTPGGGLQEDRKAARLNSSHGQVSYAVSCCNS